MGNKYTEKVREREQKMKHNVGVKFFFSAVKENFFSRYNLKTSSFRKDSYLIFLNYFLQRRYRVTTQFSAQATRREGMPMRMHKPRK